MNPGYLVAYLIFFLHLFLNYASFWDSPKLSMSSLTQFHEVFFGCPLCLIPSTFLPRLTSFDPLLSSFPSTCPNNLNLLFLIIKLIRSNPTSSLGTSLFFLSFRLTSHIHLISHFSAIQLHFMLYFHRPSLTAMHRQLLTQVAYTPCLSVITRILFQLEWVGIHKTFSKQIWFWLLLLNYILLSASNMSLKYL